MNDFRGDAIYTLLDSERKILVVKGENPDDFLQGIITNDVKNLTDKNSIYTAMLDPQGRYLFDFFIIKGNEENSLEIDVDEESSKSLKSYLLLYKLNRKIDIIEKEAVLAAQVYNIHQANGNDYNNATEDCFFFKGSIDGSQLKIVQDPRNTKMGFRAYIDNAIDKDPGNVMKILSSTGLFSDGIALGDNHKFDLLRIVLGIPERGKELIPKSSYILGCDFERIKGVSFTKGCYIGQEIVAKVKYKSSPKNSIYRVETKSKVVLPELGSVITGSRENPDIEDHKELGVLSTAIGHQGIAILNNKLLDIYGTYLKCNEIDITCKKYE